MLPYAEDDLTQGLASAKEALLVAGYREKAVVSIDAANPSAIMTLSYLQNTLQHVFAHDALVLFALVAASAGTSPPLLPLPLSAHACSDCLFKRMCVIRS
jgi:hypothetical protein